MKVISRSAFAHTSSNCPLFCSSIYIDWRCIKYCSCKHFLGPYLQLERWHIFSPLHLSLIFDTSAWLLHNKAGEWAIEYANAVIVIQQNSSQGNNDYRETEWGKGRGESGGCSLCEPERRENKHLEMYFFCEVVFSPDFLTALYAESLEWQRRIIFGI